MTLERRSPKVNTASKSRGASEPDSPNLLQDLVEFFKEPADLIIEPVSLCTPRETRRFCEVEVLEFSQCPACGLQVAVSRQVSDGEKLISSFSHSRAPLA
jgi:hypothetical protein